MTWLNPPPTVTQMRAQLLLCPSLTAAPLNMTIDSFHYPTANPTSDIEGVDPDPMPFCVIADEETNRERYAEGAMFLISGTLICTIYIGEASYQDAGSLEILGRQVLIDIAGQYFGLCFKNMKVRVASNPSQGQRAVENNIVQSSYRTIVLTLTYGLNKGR